MMDESVGHFERAAIDADVLADAEDRRVALHLFPDPLADGFEIGDLWHGLFRFFPCIRRFNFQPDVLAGRPPRIIVHSIRSVTAGSGTESNMRKHKAGVSEPLRIGMILN